VTPATATRMCDRLVKKKLIVRQSEQDDRRQVRLALTKKGLKLVGTVTNRRRREIEAILSTIAPEEQSVLVQALSQFAAAAGEVPEQDWSTGWTFRCLVATWSEHVGGNEECALLRCAVAGGSRRRPTPRSGSCSYLVGIIAGLGAVVFYEALRLATYFFLQVLAGYRVPLPRARAVQWRPRTSRDPGPYAHRVRGRTGRSGLGLYRGA